MEICLSFDNGPEPEVTPLVLDALARRGLTATFFPIGQKLRDPARRMLAERALAEGHRIGNHTLTHGVPLGLRGGSEAVAEITAAEALLGPLNPHRLFRPNGGGGALGDHLLNASAMRHLRSEAYTVVLWNAVPGDFRDPEGWPATALAQCRTATGPVLLVLHDLPNGAMRHLEGFLDRLEGEGARFTPTLPQSCLALRQGHPLCELSAISREDIAP
ncbi:polysaccharide deacetylase family protein [Roseococcus sp. SDR]|uniref:polysaccharide deacetylase family protein n=1 Tax=Roseococcus sp. SDR TaxID=2835532 RepID=UPI001BCF2A3B|nr:polysaccharide deacetylase family protein [Roseococcus sp. SDR]MBS7788958.1 polysaccharide deacetylase family protein [Roseococcus sp. SDR]MBV1844272.1 polysaccharide deacetylase family protein [Roseococcus sp. SDR]